MAAATQNPKPKCQGHRNFGVSLVTDYLDEAPEDQAEEDPRYAASRSCPVERHDPQMQWDSAPGQGRQIRPHGHLRVGNHPVDIVGTVIQTLLVGYEGRI